MAAGDDDVHHGGEGGGAVAAAEDGSHQSPMGRCHSDCCGGRPDQTSDCGCDCVTVDLLAQVRDATTVVKRRHVRASVQVHALALGRVSARVDARDHFEGTGPGCVVLEGVGDVGTRSFECAMAHGLRPVVGGVSASSSLGVRPKKWRSSYERAVGDSSEEQR